MHICSLCKKEFNDEAGYLSHVCEVTSQAPATPTSDDNPIAKAAKERGTERQKLESEGKSREEAIEATAGLGAVVN